MIQVFNDFMPTIALIAALANNNAIGKNNRLLCHLPADLKHFKELTTGHTIIMGRRTFESLPKGALPNRKNIVLSNSMSQPIDNSYFVYESLEDALKDCKNEETVFIIGGATVYKQSINKADTLYITSIHADFEADTFFPNIDTEKWREVSVENFQPDEKNTFPYSFVKYIRK